MRETGWLLWSRRQIKSDGKYTALAVFVALDGRAFASSVSVFDVRRLTGDVEEATTPGETVRCGKGGCRTSPGVRHMLLELYTVGGPPPSRSRPGPQATSPTVARSR
ncbi:hypothetical protein [Streptomyces sp. NPDC018059]|uniref:hypothetical protein n=1 Tax=Streptomyces sp. NPDC018059 TaxID=3365041 RepID=UPI00378D78E9